MLGLRPRAWCLLLFALGSTSCRNKSEPLAATPWVHLELGDKKGSRQLDVHTPKGRGKGGGRFDDDVAMTAKMTGPAGAIVEIGGEKATLDGAGGATLRISLAGLAARAPTRIVVATGDARSQRMLATDRPSVKLGELPFSLTAPGAAPVVEQLTVEATESGANDLGRLLLWNVKSGKPVPQGSRASKQLFWFDAAKPELTLYLVGQGNDGDTLGDIARVAFTTWSEPKPLGVCNFSGVAGGPGASLRFETVDAHITVHDAHTAKVVAETTIPSPRKCPSSWAAKQDETTARMGPLFDTIKAWVERQAL